MDPGFGNHGASGQQHQLLTKRFRHSQDQALRVHLKSPRWLHQVKVLCEQLSAS